ncbi:hypothetical protein F5X99DRAFT_431713 [Biscogniauxia marginata]|nr:hypothetical protein F5X99DRAFT_431713 [Biscogniauxia marginata]
MDHPDHPETRLHYDSDWTMMYIVLALIPVVFVSVALYSKRRDHVVKKEHDLEMARYTETHRRAWFPWKDAVNSSESSASMARPSTPKPTTRLPAVPSSFTRGRSNKGARFEGSKKVPPPIQVPQIHVVPSREASTGGNSTFAQVGSKEPHLYGYGNGGQDSSRYPVQENC